jgi:hypothetical protein
VRPIFSTLSNSFRLGKERVLETAERLHVAAQAQDQRESKCRRVDVVGRLAEVDVVVRVDHGVVAFSPAEAFEREVRDDLVGVHVGRGAGAALDEVGDELVAHLARDQLVARTDDRVGDRRVEDAELAVGERRRFLDVAERLDEVRLGRHRDAGDVEVLGAAQRLDAVVGALRQHLLAEEVLFDAPREARLLFLTHCDVLCR